MSASPAPALDAVAFQLAAALDEYEADVGRMVDTWLDYELYRNVSDEVERIRMFTAALAQLAVPWVELLIAHTELVHALWRRQFGDGHDERVAELRAYHSECIASIKRRCMRQLGSRPAMAERPSRTN